MMAAVVRTGNGQYHVWSKQECSGIFQRDS